MQCLFKESKDSAKLSESLVGWAFLIADFGQPKFGHLTSSLEHVIDSIKQLLRGLKYEVFSLFPMMSDMTKKLSDHDIFV